MTKARLPAPFSVFFLLPASPPLSLLVAFFVAGRNFPRGSLSCAGKEHRSEKAARVSRSPTTVRNRSLRVLGGGYVACWPYPARRTRLALLREEGGSGQSTAGCPVAAEFRGKTRLEKGCDKSTRLSGIRLRRPPGTFVRAGHPLSVSALIALDVERAGVHAETQNASSCSRPLAFDAGGAQQGYRRRF